MVVQKERGRLWEEEEIVEIAVYCPPWSADF